jgi:hypothetical protein
VVVRDLNFVDIASLPSEANPILIVDSNAMLPAPVPAQPFEMIPPWNSEFAEISDSINLIEFPPGHLPQIPGTRSSSHGSVNAVKDVLGASATERAYHGQHYNDIRDTSQLLPESVDPANPSVHPGCARGS